MGVSYILKSYINVTGIVSGVSVVGKEVANISGRHATGVGDCMTLRGKGAKSVKTTPGFNWENVGAMTGSRYVKSGSLFWQNDVESNVGRFVWDPGPICRSDIWPAWVEWRRTRK